MDTGPDRRDGELGIGAPRAVWGKPLSGSRHIHLFRNDGGNRNNWLSVRTVGVQANRDGIGAVVRVQSASGKQWSLVRSGSSYASESDHALTFGLGTDKIVSSLEIEWPGGSKQTLSNVPVNQGIVIEQGKGIVSQWKPAKSGP